MSLSPGEHLGPYEVLGPIGAGGMGEVYRARDTRLDRTVALKVLPTELAADPQLRARFEREARAISTLAHPNICTLYDVGEENGRTYLVMEHLVGETLAERLKKGPLPLERVLEIGAQIADGLRVRERGQVSVWPVHSATGRTTAIPRTDAHSVGDRVLVNGSCASGSGPARACRAHGLQGRSPGSPWCCV